MATIVHLMVMAAKVVGVMGVVMMAGLLMVQQVVVHLIWLLLVVFSAVARWIVHHVGAIWFVVVQMGLVERVRGISVVQVVMGPVGDDPAGTAASSRRTAS